MQRAEAQRMVGLGDPKSKFRVYIANRPDYANLLYIDNVRPVAENEIGNIGQRCGNGWRKVFNVYAKLVFALNAELHADLRKYQSWQLWRDHCLLREKSNSLLLFSKPMFSRAVFSKAELSKPQFCDLRSDEDTDISKGVASDTLHLIMGKGWARECLQNETLYWLNQDFAIIESHNIIVCPYFDYRQLSNQKIMFLCDLINTQMQWKPA